MAVVYVEVKDNKTIEFMTTPATINQPLANQFQINGFSMTEARDLALLLRAGIAGAKKK